MPLVEVRNISKQFGNTTVLRDLSLIVRCGQALCLFGPSGCGKTTTLRIIARLERPNAGEVVVDGRRVNSVGERVPPSPGALGMVFQDLALWPHMRVRRHIDFVLRGAGLKRAQRLERIRDAIERCRLSGCERAFPSDLSGGEQQRLAIARAIAPDPSLLLLDEPLANLDSDLRDHFLAEFRRRKQNGATLIFATHSCPEAEALADEILLLTNGGTQK
jgi:iron(III) transport system ATP-binding protein